ncbi:beta-glucosidase [Rhizodiscina lignyota]|uniref:beta-glucosidase n=1 Tax=Rhizodiscina lignyota TaxID=1504668 RepID=A0A9P4IAT5_9PEZI|nr:beta-glucosidase [Rhizodiscina lignyota]
MLQTVSTILLFALQVLADPPGGSFTPRIVTKGYGNWSEAYEKARAFVCDLTLTEKVNLTTAHGTGVAVGYSFGVIPRKGFRGLAWDDSPTGVRGSDYSSAGAAGLNLAMSWDRELIYLQMMANGAEHKAKGLNGALAPVVGPLGRAPEGGRNFESYSPDPYLSGIAFGESIAGMQAGGTIAVGKHYILYEQEHFREVRETNDFGYSPFNITEPYTVSCDDRTFHELYLWPWYDAVQKGMAGVMCSYNQVNGTQTCQNDHLMNDILKGELGFQGFITSDDGSQHSGIASALAGMDVTGPGETSPNGIDGLGISFWGPNLTLSVLNGSVPEWRLDDMATRIMAAYYYLGQDHDFPDLNFGGGGTYPTFGFIYPNAKLDYQQINFHVDVRDAHADVIRAVGANSITLLKNVNNTLPLKKPRQIAVVGEDAGPSMYGPNGCADRGCNNGTLAMGWGSGSTNFPYLVDPLAAIQARALRDRTEVQYVLNNFFAKTQIDSIVQQATVSLVFVNADSGEGYIEIDNNFGDRKNLTAWGRGDDLIKEVAANCSNTVVVIHAVGPILMEEWIDHPNVTAALFAGLPGQESGNSLVDVLYGDVTPSGKLPWTVGKTREDYGTDVLYAPNAPVPHINFTEGLFIDYRHFDKAGIEPRFEFGFGLSYTTFEYSDLHIEKLSSPAVATPAASYAPQTTFNPQICPSSKLNPSDYTFPSTISSIPNFIYPYLNANVTYTSNAAAPSSSIAPAPAGPQGGPPELYAPLYSISFSLKNTGEVSGQEVSQLYVNLGNGEPIRQLRGFNKTMLAAGVEKTVTIELRMRDLSIWDVVNQEWVDVTTLGTTVELWVGASSRDLKLKGEIAAAGGYYQAAAAKTATATTLATSTV